ncbi:MAG: hypothetical protein ABIF18_02700 [archaeon]
MKIDIMPWSVCERSFIRKIGRDDEEIASIIEGAMLRKKRADETFRNNKYVSFVMEDYYEIIKEILVAYMLKGGLRSKNHQCMISYFLMKNPDYDIEARLIGQMCFYRNKLNYYGKSVPKVFVLDNYENFNKIIKLILKLIEDVKNE